MIEIGDLLNIRGELCLVMNIRHDYPDWNKKALIQWVHNSKEHWISYEILTELKKETKEEDDES